MTDQPAAVVVGAPVYRREEIGHVVGIVQPTGGQTFTLGTGRMVPVRHEFEVCFADRVTTLPDNIVSPWLEAAQRMGLPTLSPEEVETARQTAAKATADRRAFAEEERKASQARAAAFRLEAESKMPPGAKAVIIGELIEDRSDVMTDYFGSTTVRTVILAWSGHTRDLFPELRKAALNHPDTAPLAQAPASADHREKYSMGAGYYLKAGSRDCTGWKVRKVTLYRGAESVPVGEWSLPTWAPPADAAPVPGEAPAQLAGARIEKHHNDRKGFDYWLVILADRVEREEYDRLLTAARGLGGWYSRPWGGLPGGFAFKAEAKARAFMGEAPAAAAPTVAPTAPASNGCAAMASKLRGLADAMQGEIDSKFRDRLTNTPKRQREAQSQRLDGFHLQRTQRGLRALADQHEAGMVPPDLRGVTTKAAAFDLARAEIVKTGGYYDAGRETGKPATDTPQARAFWSLFEDRSDADKASDALRLKVEELQFAKIPGYFPTPGPVIAQMFGAANIPPGQPVRILEPSAGSGAILDQAAYRYPAAILSAYERHATLRGILQAKGYTLDGADFTEAQPQPVADYVLMNPPFENGQDMQHVRHAFDFLAPGGRLVAIMSPGPFFRQNAKAAAFRAWFDDLAGERVDIPAGAFKESGTGVATVLVVIDKPA